jgi:hypothetical protein
MESRSNLLFQELCMEIDDLREAVAYWKEKYEKEATENNRRIDEQLKSSQVGVANMLALAFALQDNQDGSLSISKEKRLVLCDTIKTTTTDDEFKDQVQ